MKKFIIIIFAILTSLISNAQETHRFVSVRYFDEYGDLCKKVTITSLITISDQTYKIDTKGADKVTLYRCHYFNTDFPIKRDRYISNSGIICYESNELCIDILPSQFDAMPTSQRINHVFTVTVTDLYNEDTYLSSMLDVKAESTQRAIRYTTTD